MRRETVYYPFYYPFRLGATGQARVRIDGKSIYLGEYGSEESRRRYDEVVTDYVKGTLNVSFHKLTISQLSIAYVKHARSYYVKNGRITSEVSNIQVALRPLVKLHGKGLVAEFGPTKLKQVRELMIQNGIVRKSINRGIGRIERMFRWGVENEIVSTNVLAAINSVPGIRYGRTTAVEAAPVKPVPDEHIAVIEGRVNRFVWGMIQLQLATGMRPGEVRLMRTCDIDLAGDVWEYRPQEHKTEHHGRKRLIFIGPHGQHMVISTNSEPRTAELAAVDRKINLARVPTGLSPEVDWPGINFDHVPTADQHDCPLAGVRGLVEPDSRGAAARRERHGDLRRRHRHRRGLE